MRKFLLLVSLLMLNAAILFAQNVPVNRPTFNGTYQIEVLNTRERPLIPNNLEELVKKHRKEKQVSYYEIANNVRLRILPTSEITKPDFVPLDLEIIHKYTY